MTLGQLEDTVANKATCSTLAIGKGYLNIVLRVNWKRRGRPRLLATNIISLNRGNDRTLLDETTKPNEEVCQEATIFCSPSTGCGGRRCNCELAGIGEGWQVVDMHALFWQVSGRYNLITVF